MRYLTILAVTLLASCSFSWPWQWGDADTGSCLDDNSCDEANPFEEALVGGTWYCYGQTRDEPWDCAQDEDTSKIVAVSDEDRPQAPVASRSIAETLGAPAGAPAAATVRSESNLLSDLPDSHFAVQLIAVQTRQEVDSFAQQYSIESPTFVRISTQGDFWYVVLLGTYDNKDEADLAAETWNEQNQPFSKPWVRPIGPLKTAASHAQSAGT